MEFSLPLVIACIIIFLALIVFPLVISYKSEKKENTDEGNKINDETRKKH